MHVFSDQQLKSKLNLQGIDPKIFRSTLDKVLSEKRLSDFTRLSAPLVEPNPLVWGWHLDAVCEHLQAVEEGHIKRLIINIPPRSLKSTIVSVIYPAWAWARNPSLKFLTGSHGADLAVRDTRKSRVIVESDWYQEFWGDKVKLCTDQNQKKYYENTANGYRVSFSTGSWPMGKGGDRILLDDPLSLNAAWSKTKRDSINSMLGEGMFTRLNPQAGGVRGAIIVIMQRLGVEDCTGYLLDRFGKDYWEHLVLPLEFEPSRRCKTSIFIDPRKKEGESLCPEFFTPSVIADMKAEYGKDGSAGQLQQRPNVVGGNILNINDFVDYTVRPTKFLRVIQGWDTAFKQKQRNDYSVCITVGETATAYYILDVMRNKLRYNDLIKKMIDLDAEWKPAVILIEDKASGQSAIQSLQDDTKLLIKAINFEGDKEYRLNLAKPVVESRKVMIPERSVWRADFIDEMAAFPKAPHDDQVDTFSLIFNWLRENKVGGGTPRVLSWR